MDNNEACKPVDNCTYPHSPEVWERVTADNGFSEGWGMHFMPVEEYWTDIHTHLEIENVCEYREKLQFYKKIANILDFKYTSVIIELKSAAGGEEGYRETEWQAVREINEIEGMFPFLYVNYKNPDPELIEKAVMAGIRGIKLHNAGVITEGVSCKVWLSAAWREVFRHMEEHRLPVLWHVTQRLTGSPYMGGGKNTYWEDGWKKGVEYTNRDLLDVFLEIAGCYSGISFIGAHQLHMGWDRVAGLFEQYPNLSVDTSCGCIVRQFDQIYEYDRNYLRDYFIKYGDRILFGTDTIIYKDTEEYDIVNNCTGHMRFIRQLRLPHTELQKITCGNFERIFGLR